MAKEDLERLDCPVARRCGGCALFELPYGAQLAEKRRQVGEALAAHPELRGVEIDACSPAPARTHYRNRAKLSVVVAGGSVRAGLHRRGTNEVVDLEPCRVHAPALSAKLPEFKNWLGRYDLATPSGPVKHLDMRLAENDGIHLTLVVGLAEDRLPDLPLDDLAALVPRIVGVSVNFNPRSSSYVFGPVTRTLLGSRTFMAPLPSHDGGAISFEVPATGFFQVAPAQLPPIHGLIGKHLGTGGALLDLYCGVGVHGLALGGSPVVGIEESPAAAACARRNAHRLGVEARYASGPVEKLLPEEIARIAPVGVILNPGRSGCRRTVLEGLEPGRARRIAYLSCEPRTLARDLAVLVRAGWNVRRIVPIDMMPHTDQVEALALLVG